MHCDRWVEVTDSSAQIVTLTLNPALDLTYFLAEASVGEVDVHRATAAMVEASGKGVNVSRALHVNGVPTVAVLPLGGPAGRHLAELLDAEHVPRRVIDQQTPTRINTTVALRCGDTAKINGPGGELTRGELDALLGEIATALQGLGGYGETWLAICGSLPPGVDTTIIGELIALAHENGARCAVDATGAALEAAIAACADLVAPNRLELADIDRLAACADTVEDVARVAAGISRRAGAALLVSLGGDGALYTDGATTVHGFGTALVPVNTAGAGDALLSGWLARAGVPSDRMARAIRWSRAACRSATTVAPAMTAEFDIEPITVTFV